MTPGQLYDVLDSTLARTGWTWRHPFRFRRHVLWLTGPFVKIGSATWWAGVHDYRGHGYTRRQLIEMKEALRPALMEYEDPLERIVAALHPERPQ